MSSFAALLLNFSPPVLITGGGVGQSRRRPEEAQTPLQGRIIRTLKAVFVTAKRANTGIKKFRDRLWMVPHARGIKKQPRT